ncbi:hypothetical protein FEZ41_08015 [Lentilactobacillus parafarraginis]|uniref:Uncharacterized protein n=3 Tax=Lentilactobacillus parafarraginis TaxID=390842 RepID=A0A0R1Z498_9LACO|nr:hypothetical protein [Lentilactobacillus parafarraginis]EHL99281.1 hypothetical protein HMPREF9103_01110 [Lentilactobacillus parafarraginis F0439]KRM45827.1 hypothetical protein FD47_GL000007 [Lentilactobacillus parafarraginis DSM 18390 = JCM 14109]TLQ19098.1 hypothetical protein FEZ41_08015 [Lentilactobacillus parafarraginis]
MAEETDYPKLLEQLANGDIDKFTVHPEDFMAFQVAFMNFDKRKRVIGTADQGGVVTYVFESNPQEKKS